MVEHCHLSVTTPGKGKTPPVTPRRRRGCYTCRISVPGEVVTAGAPSQSPDLGLKALFPAQGCGSPGTAACEGVGWGCQHFTKYSPVSMETGSPHLKFQCSQCSPLTGLMGDEKLMFDLHVIAVLWDRSPCPWRGSHRSRGAGAQCTPLVPAARWCGRATAWRLWLRFWLVNPEPSKWGWSHGGVAGDVGMELPARAPADPGGISMGCQPGGCLCLC